MTDPNSSNPLATLQKSRLSSKEKILSRIMLLFEDIIKVPLFRCQHCGECILSHTGFVCSQRCPKRLRNGPCGGTGEGGTCEVYPERKCIWSLIYRRTRRYRRIPLLKRIEKIHNWELEKTSAWLNVLKKRIDPPVLFIRRKR
ncbi:MAG: methylenetetrahydrofolate reductase C-terminal domain-containing protein [Candidatus Aminicenantes bacterium]|jgi:methylenetetrahydrofolate reductase (NADPH)